MADTTPNAEASSAQNTLSIWSLSVICSFAWIIPGMGHFLVKKPKHGLVFFVLITFLFVWGMDLGAKIYQYDPQQPLTFFAMIAQVGMGIPYFIIRVIASYARLHTDSAFYGFAESFRFGDGFIENVTFEYGNTFAIVAGLLNFLVILDAYDIATGRKALKNA